MSLRLALILVLAMPSAAQAQDGLKKFFGDVLKDTIHKTTNGQVSAKDDASSTDQAVPEVGLVLRTWKAAIYPINHKCNFTFSGNFETATAALTILRADGSRIPVRGELVAKNVDQRPYTTLVMDFGDTFVGTLTRPDGRVETLERIGRCQNLNGPTVPPYASTHFPSLFLDVRPIAQ